MRLSNRKWTLQDGLLRRVPSTQESFHQIELFAFLLAASKSYLLNGCHLASAEKRRNPPRLQKASIVDRPHWIPIQFIIRFDLIDSQQLNKFY